MQLRSVAASSRVPRGEQVVDEATARLVGAVQVGPHRLQFGVAAEVGPAGQLELQRVLGDLVRADRELGRVDLGSRELIAKSTYRLVELGGFRAQRRRRRRRATGRTRCGGSPSSAGRGCRRQAVRQPVDRGVEIAERVVGSAEPLVRRGGRRSQSRLAVAGSAMSARSRAIWCASWGSWPEHVLLVCLGRADQVGLLDRLRPRAWCRSPSRRSTTVGPSTAASSSIRQRQAYRPAPRSTSTSAVVPGPSGSTSAYTARGALDR